ncbi:MAG: redoxin family protein [Phycisphaerales bacterium]|nr:redoxin family protein [Phycisphaerales bacterium]
MKKSLLSLASALVLGAGLGVPAAHASRVEAIALEPSLKVGDAAPAFSVESFIQGDKFEAFETGKVYVVEFWATWCGPCIAMMPHMSHMQKEYKDEGVTFVGVNMEEFDPSQLTPETKTMVEKWVKDSGKMGYTVVYDGPAGAMAKSYFQAADQNGIPASFVIDRDNKIAWIGHPMWLDEVIKPVAKGTWDAEKDGARLAKGEQMLDAVFMNAGEDAKAAIKEYAKFAEAYPGTAKIVRQWLLPVFFEAGEYAMAYEAAGSMADEAIANKDSQGLNQIAWTIVDPQGSVEKKDLELAMRCAKAAADLTNHEDAAILDTLARVHFLKGDIDEAIKVQTKAVDKAEEPMKAELQTTLDEYKNAKGQG